MLDFLTRIGLPCTLAEIGIQDPTCAKLEAVAQRATTPGETIPNEPFEVTVDMVVDAVVAADAAGRAFQDSGTNR